MIPPAIVWGPGRTPEQHFYAVFPYADRLVRERFIWLGLAQATFVPRLRLAGCAWDLDRVFGLWMPGSPSEWVYAVIYRRVSDPPKDRCGRFT